MGRNCSLYVMGEVQCNQPAPRCLMVSQCWFLMLAGWELSSDNTRTSLVSGSLCQVKAKPSSLPQWPLQINYSGIRGKRLTSLHIRPSCSFWSLKVSSVVNTIQWAPPAPMLRGLNTHWFPFLDSLISECWHAPAFCPYIPIYTPPFGDLS